LHQIATSKLPSLFLYIFTIFCFWGSFKLFGNGDNPWLLSPYWGALSFFCFYFGLIVGPKDLCVFLNNVLVNEDDINELKI